MTALQEGTTSTWEFLKERWFPDPLFLHDRESEIHLYFNVPIV